MAANQATYIRTALRIPPDLHKIVHDSAKAQDRTFNGQLLAMLKEAAQAQQQKQAQGEMA